MSTLVPSKTRAYSRRYDKLRRAGYLQMVDGTLTRRKLGALWALGHSWTSLGERMGRTQQSVSYTYHSTAPVHRTTAKAVGALYEELHLFRPEGREAEWVRAKARREGAAPPLAYDDITDLTENPKGLRK